MLAVRRRILAKRGRARPALESGCRHVTAKARDAPVRHRIPQQAEYCPRAARRAVPGQPLVVGEKPALLKKALAHSHAVVSAWSGKTLVGLGNAISDGHLVVYYPHMLMHPDYHGRGIGTEIMRRLKERYRGFHQHVLIADGRAVEFYRKCGFTRAGKTEPMWIYAGTDH